MTELSVKTRKVSGRKVKSERKKGLIPAVLYGPEIKGERVIELDYKEFEKIYKEAGESSLIKITLDKENFLVLIHEVSMDPISGKFMHVDFYQPKLSEEIEVTIPLVFEGIAPAVKDLGGTFIKNLSEIDVKAKPQNLPKELKINIESLRTFEDNVKIKDIVLPEGVKIAVKDQMEIVAQVVPAEKVEEELVKPIEEKVEDVAKVEKEKKETGEEDTAGTKSGQK